jgi:hypothetical protein
MAKSKRPSTSPTPTPKAETFQRVEGFVSKYANNVRYESTVHDLKLIFGESDQAAGPEVVRQHTAITIPWTAAKLARYYLDVNLLFHEVYVSKIEVASNQIPLPFSEPSPEMIATDPLALKAYTLASKLRDEFIGSK